MKKEIALISAVFIQAAPFHSIAPPHPRRAHSFAVSTDAPSFRPETWTPNGSLAFRSWYNTYANCYEYALGDKDLVISRLTLEPLPGQISARHLLANQKDIDAYKKEMTRPGLTTLAEQDGLRATGDSVRAERGSYPVALFIRDDTPEFHWMRLNGGTDKNAGLWSQKFSDRTPTLVAFENHTPIRNPADISLTPYGIAFRDAAHSCTHCYKFGGYFNVPVSGLTFSASIINRSFARQDKIYPSEILLWRRQLQHKSPRHTFHVTPKG